MTDFRESDTMSLFDKKHLVSPADALPGRNTPMPVATLHAVNGHSMTNVPDGMEIAIFAMGCFWGVERLFWQLPGVYSTAAGYTGGYTDGTEETLYVTLDPGKTYWMRVGARLEGQTRWNFTEIVEIRVP